LGVGGIEGKLVIYNNRTNIEKTLNIVIKWKTKHTTQSEQIQKYLNY